MCSQEGIIKQNMKWTEPKERTTTKIDRKKNKREKKGKGKKS